MTLDFKTTINKTELAKNRKLPCQKCNESTPHLLQTGVQREVKNVDADISTWDDYGLYKCEKCNQICFIHQTMDSMESCYSVDDLDFNSHSFMYPGFILGTQHFDFEKVPNNIIQLHKETISALNNKSPVLAGVEIRCIIECVCKNQGIIKGGLQNKIDCLADLNLIDKSAANIFHKLRFMGNRAVHEAETHSQSELQLALSITEHLVSNIYKSHENT